MKLRKIVSVLLVSIMALSLCMTAGAADVTLHANQNNHSPKDVTKIPYALYFNAGEATCGVAISCPSYGNSLGNAHFGLYAWQGDYESTVESTELYGQNFVDFKDNATLTFNYPTAPEGEYLVVVVGAEGSDQIGVWHEGNVSEASKGFSATAYYNGSAISGVPSGKIITGASATLGSLKISGGDEEPIDIGTALTSVIPAKTFEEKIAESIIMYTGSSTAYVGAKTRMIDKYNKFVTPVVVNDCAMLPVRFVAENLGTSLEWDDANQIIKMERNGTTIEMQIGSSFMKLNGENVALQVAPQIIHGRTMIPLRAVSEALYIPIHWRADGANGLIIIGETCEDLGEDLTVVGTLLSKLKMK